MEFKDYIKIRGAREHNLKNIDIDIPKNALVVFSGVSGSGKSTLVFDTIFKEGQNRYLETLSPYFRQFFKDIKNPELDSIQGLSPPIAIDQKTTSSNPRSTVGTITGIYDYFKLLYATIGKPYDPNTGIEIQKSDLNQIIKQVLSKKEDTKLYIMIKVVDNEKGSFINKILHYIELYGYRTFIIDEDEYLIEAKEDIPKLNLNQKHSINIILGKYKINQRNKTLIAETIDKALELNNGQINVKYIYNDKEELKLYSTSYYIESENTYFPKLESRFFSFNNPEGACFKCNGIGVKYDFDIDLILNKDRSLKDNYMPINFTYFSKIFQILAEEYNFSYNDTPIKDLPLKAYKIILYGSDKIYKITYEKEDLYSGRKSNFTLEDSFKGIINELNRIYKNTQSKTMQEKLEIFMSKNLCIACRGARLNNLALSVKIKDLNIAQLSAMSISRLNIFFDKLILTERENNIAKLILKEIKNKLFYLNNVGLNYLTLSRVSSTLSGGESQRIRLTSQISGSLSNVLFILDEPSIGLHQRDNQKLIDTILKLKHAGNSVLLVEHDQEIINTCDYLIDIGPEAGSNGGKVVAQGPLSEVLKVKNSLTVDYLVGRKKINISIEKRKGNNKFIELTGLSENNLKNIDLKLPLAKFTVVTGVSGSGKSTLITDILYPALFNELKLGNKKQVGKFKSIKGYENIDKLIFVNQDPIGRTSRSNAVTYTKTFDAIRDLFASTTEAKVKGYKVGRFSFNTKQGICEACQGEGYNKIAMDFLPDVYVECKICLGKRFNKETLNIKYKNKNISDVLDMTVKEAYDFFNNINKIRDKLETLKKVGLDYLKLGQRAPTLSGGESQRVKLALELSKKASGNTLYILDEPTTGLHFHDVAKLLDILNELANRGNTIVIIEHNMDVIASADWIIDLGPEGGDEGGYILAQNNPFNIINNDKSLTAKYLKKYFQEKKLI